MTIFPQTQFKTLIVSLLQALFKDAITSTRTSSLFVSKSRVFSFKFLYLLSDCGNFGLPSTGQPQSLRLELFRLKGHQKPRKEIGCLSPAERLAGFESRSFWFNRNALTHWATLTSLVRALGCSQLNCP